MTKVILRKGKRGHKNTEINLKEGLLEREKQNLINVLKQQYRSVIIKEE